MRVAISTSSFGVESSAPLDLLAKAGCDVRPNPHGRTLKAAEIDQHLDGISALIAGTEQLTGDVLRRHPSLKVISRVGTGTDNVDREAANALGILVFNTPDAHVDAVAELAIGGILAALRGVAASHVSIATGGFAKPMGRLLRGKTVGLIGYGRVARALHQLLSGFGCAVIYVDPVAQPAGGTTLDHVLAASDIVSLHVPYSKANHHLVGGAQLARLKTDALLVNTSRGGLIDEDALLAHLTNNSRASAYLDCFANEPYQGPLANHPRVLTTAHIGSYAREARIQMETEAVQNALGALGLSS